MPRLSPASSLAQEYLLTAVVQVQEKRASLTSAIQSSACVTFANLPFTKATHMAGWLGPQHPPPHPESILFQLSAAAQQNTPKLSCLKWRLLSLTELWVKNSGRAWLSYSFDSHDIRGTELVDGLGWRVRGSFTHMSDALARSLGSATQTSQTSGWTPLQLGEILGDQNPYMVEALSRASLPKGLGRKCMTFFD